MALQELLSTPIRLWPVSGWPPTPTMEETWEGWEEWEVEWEEWEEAWEEFPGRI